MPVQPKLLVFDVNETLLDLNPLKDKVNHALGNDLAFNLWFSKLLHYSLVETVTEHYSDFSSIAASTFQMVAQNFKVDIPDAKVDSILATIKSLPPHKDVIAALTLLQNAGFTMVALTNGNQEVADKQLIDSGIAPFLKQIISVEHVGRYKPHVDAYTYVLNVLSVAAKEAMMIAAHGWDIVGARRAGMQTAFVARAGQIYLSIGEKSRFDR